MAQTVKNPPAMKEAWDQSLGWEDPLEKGMETHSSILAWRIPGQRSLVGYSPWVLKEMDTTECLTHTVLNYTVKETAKSKLLCLQVYEHLTPFTSK